MKEMTCKELGGACQLAFRAATFEEIATLSKEHAMAMFKQQHQPHLDAMAEMQSLMQDESTMAAWFNERKRVFSAKPDV